MCINESVLDERMYADWKGKKRKRGGGMMGVCSWQ